MMLMCQLFGSPSLYLPGLVDPVLGPESSSLPYENLPGSDFSTHVIWSTYCGTDNVQFSVACMNQRMIDYSCETNFDMWLRW
jgi:hypothetical protein